MAERFRTVDEVLLPWARSHGLYVSTEYKDEEVRSIAIVDDSGSEYQMWLTLTPDGGVTVHAWDYAELRVFEGCEMGELPTTLETVYRSVEQWIARAGHTRTSVL